MSPIGVYLPERVACGDRHLPGCYNPNIQQTWCVCGEQRWEGFVGTWHSIARHEPAPAAPLLGIGVGAVGMREPERKLIGWDTYFIHANECPARLEPDDEDHICGEATA